MPFAARPIAMMPVMVIVGVMPVIAGIVAVAAPPSVIVEGKPDAREMHPAGGVPAIAFPIACGVSRRRHAEAQAGRRGEDGGQDDRTRFHEVLLHRPLRRENARGPARRPSVLLTR